MRDFAVRRDPEDCERCQRPENPDESLRLNPAVGGEVIKMPIAIGWDTISSSNVGHEAEHAGDLEPSEQKIERWPLAFNFLRLCHFSILGVRLFWLPAQPLEYIAKQGISR